MQALFLEERDYVVPPTAAHCFPLPQYRELVDAKAQPTFKRLASVRGHLEERLAVLEQFEVSNDMLISVTPAPTQDYTQGYRWTSGQLQVGLNQREIRGIAARTKRLLEQLRRGQVQLF